MVDRYRITDYGAAGDGETPDTAAIQRAIDCCSAHGGGSVEIPAGVFLTGTIALKSNVLLYLAHGARLLASRNPADYRKLFPDFDGLVTHTSDSPFNLDQFLIYAYFAENTGICGS